MLSFTKEYSIFITSLYHSFNAFGGCNCIMRTCAARIALLKDDERERLEEEIKHRLINYGGLCVNSLYQMHTLESFVLEVNHQLPSFKL